MGKYARQRTTCVMVDVDGEQVMARFTGEPDEDDLAAFREIVRAVRRKFDGE